MSPGSSRRHIARVLLLVVVGLGAPVAAKEKLPAPVHPDTLPTLFQMWTLPASLAPALANVHAPRMARSGMLLYVYDHNGRRLVAVESATGKVRWHAPVPPRSARAFAFTPLIYKGRVYVANDGYLYSLDALTGRVRWRLGTKGVAVNGLARSKHRIYLPWIRVAKDQAVPGVQLWAIDSRRGRVEWSKKFPGRMAYVEGDSDGVYYAGSSGVLLGLTPDRGDYKWQLRLKAKVVQPPLLKSGKLFVTSLHHKAGRRWTGITVVDVKTGKVLWKSKVASTMVSPFLHQGKLVLATGSGRLVGYDDDGKQLYDLDLGFIDKPTSLHAVSVEDRGFVFSSHLDGNGYIRLVDLGKRRVIASANALDMAATSMLPSGKTLFLDGANGTVYAYRLDRSQRPKRRSVPPMEFATELLERVRETKTPVTSLARKLAGLGPKALPAIEPALEWPNPYVVEVAASAIGLVESRRSVPALLKALQRLAQAPAPKGTDPLLAVVDALAQIRDGRAVAPLQQLVQQARHDHFRRRAAYVALGAIGSPAALAPIWSFRAEKQVNTTRWQPMAYTPSFTYGVEQDVDVPFESVDGKVRKRTLLTVQTKEGEVYTAALSPYLGGYNDIWLGKSDLSGAMTQPMFTGLTHASVRPDRRIRIHKLKVGSGNKVRLQIKLKQGKKWVKAKPVSIALVDLVRDRDRDKLPDIVEQRLHLCRELADCDGDGLSDAEDLNPLASGKLKLSVEQRLYQEAFFAYFAFLKRRGLVVLDPGEGPSFEVYGRRDPVISLRRDTIERFRKEVGLHAVDYVSFGGPYPEGEGTGDALPSVVWNKRKTEAKIGMDIFRSADNAVAYNVTLKKVGKKWVVTRLYRVWTTNR